MYGCPIVGCENYGNITCNVRYFFVSKTYSELVKKWVESIRTYMPEFPDDISNHRICQLHFDPEDLKSSESGLQLRFGAIPKRFPGSETHPKIVPRIPVALQRVTINRKPNESIKQPQDPFRISSKPQNAVIFGISKCTDCKGQIQAMQRRMYALQEQIIEQQYEITTLHKRNQYLKLFEPDHVQKTEECSVCKLKLTTDELYLHLCQQINNESDIRCEYCLKSYNSTKKLLNHLRVSHDQKLEKRIYRCKQCPEIFDMVKLLDIHMRTHSENKTNQNNVQTQHPMLENPLLKPFQCGYSNCDEQFDSAKLLQEHMRKNHEILRTKEIITKIELEKRKENITFECYLCRQFFETFIDARHHIDNQHKIPNGTLKAKCSVCWTNLYETEVNGHLCEHVARSIGSIDCEYCPEKLTSIVQSFKHINTKHAKEKTLYRCIKCTSTYPIKRLLEFHNVVHTSEIYKCKKCATVRSFQTLKALNNHMRRHEKVKNYLCEDCGKSFKMNQSLKAHKLSHYPHQYPCDQCEKTFSNSLFLRKHQKLHSDQTYSCNLCNVKCSTSDKLLIHIKRHTQPKVKRFECSTCGVKFASRYNLKKHLSTVHSTIRQFQCEYCPRNYKHKGDLSKHLRTHLGDDMYECPNVKCDRRFRTQYDLQKHSSVHFVEEREAQKMRDQRMDCME